jgi:hypothetical protein
MDVILHIYDLTQGIFFFMLFIINLEINDKMYKYGFGFFHTGVEVDGKGNNLF